MWLKGWTNCFLLFWVCYLPPCHLPYISCSHRNTRLSQNTTQFLWASFVIRRASKCYRPNDVFAVLALPEDCAAALAALYSHVSSSTLSGWYRPFKQLPFFKISETLCLGLCWSSIWEVEDNGVMNTNYNENLKDMGYTHVLRHITSYGTRFRLKNRSTLTKKCSPNANSYAWIAVSSVSWELPKLYMDWPIRFEGIQLLEYSRWVQGHLLRRS